MYFVFQSGHFVGSSPTKSALTKFQNFEKKSKSKKFKIFFAKFGSKNHSKSCHLVSGVRENGFFNLKKILKIFDI